MNVTKKSICFMSMVAGLAGLSISQLALADSQPSAQTVKETVKEEVRDLADALKSYTADRKAEAIKEVKSSLAKLDEKISAIEVRVATRKDKADEAVRKQLTESLIVLRERRVQLEKWYVSLENSSAASWEHSKEGFSGAYASLKQSWQKIEKEFEQTK